MKNAPVGRGWLALLLRARAVGRAWWMVSLACSDTHTRMRPQKKGLGHEQSHRTRGCSSSTGRESQARMNAQSSDTLTADPWCCNRLLEHVAFGGCPATTQDHSLPSTTSFPFCPRKFPELPFSTPQINFELLPACMRFSVPEQG